MSGNNDKIKEQIFDTLEDIKRELESSTAEMQALRQTIENAKNEKRLSAERLCDKMDRALISISNVVHDVKRLTPVGVLANYQLRNPEVVDTSPIEMREELDRIANEIQDDVEKQCTAMGDRMSEMLADRDPIQCLSDYVHLLKSIRDEIVSRRSRVEALKNRRRNADKDSNEQKNAAILIVKVRSMIKPLEKFSEFILSSFFKKRRRIMSEVWRTTVAIEEMYEEKTDEYKERIPAASASAPITSALKELQDIARRHDETFRANTLVSTGNMSALERRKVLAQLKK